MRVVGWYPASNDGCALYRMFMPHLHYPGSQYYLATPGTRLTLDMLHSVNVAVVQRQMTAGNLEAIKLIKAGGRKVIYDLDDNFWKVPKWNPAHTFFRQTDITNNMVPCMRLADVITVSTPYLGKVVNKRAHIANAKIVVIENTIDFNLFGRSTRFYESDRVVVGWAGTSTHSMDLDPAMNALSKVMKEHDFVDAEIMGGAVPPQLYPFKDTPRIKWHPWVAPKQYPATFSNLRWDLALAPLLKSEFNLSKSNIKMLEASTLGVPCLASDLENYRLYCEGSEDLQYLLCKTEEDWYTKIKELAHDKARRMHLAEAMKRRTVEQYDISLSVQKWRGLVEAL